MRIIITSTGKKEIQTLSPTPTISSFFRRTFNSTKSSPVIQRSSSSVTNVQIKKQKLIFNSDITNKYIGKTYYPTESILPTKKFSKHQISLKEIIEPKVFSLMIKKMKRDIEIKNKLSVIDNQHFRTQSGKDKNEMKSLKLICKNKKIDSDRFNLITYLNNKKEINPITLKTLSKMNQNQIDTKDKVCQIVLLNKEKENSFKSVIENKLKNKRLNAQKKINRIANDIEFSSTILEKYKPRTQRFDRYIDAYDDFKRYWKKFDYERLLNKKNKNSLPTEDD